MCNVGGRRLDRKGDTKLKLNVTQTMTDRSVGTKILPTFPSINVSLANAAAALLSSSIRIRFSSSKRCA